MAYQKRSKDQLAQRVAQDIHDGADVTLGIGMPGLGGTPAKRNSAGHHGQAKRATGTTVSKR